jgi:hypothetical protein
MRKWLTLKYRALSVPPNPVKLRTSQMFSGLSLFSFTLAIGALLVVVALSWGLHWLGSLLT